jgi:hypothetical protein
MLCRVAFVRTDVSEERSVFFIRVTRIAELGTTVAQFLRRVRRLLVTASFVPSSPILVTPDEGDAKFLRNVGSYKTQTA